MPVYREWRTEKLNGVTIYLSDSPQNMVVIAEPAALSKPPKHHDPACHGVKEHLSRCRAEAVDLCERVKARLAAHGGSASLDDLFPQASSKERKRIQNVLWNRPYLFAARREGKVTVWRLRENN